MYVRNRQAEGREIVHADFIGYVEGGETVEVPDHVGLSLVDQPDVWEEASGASSRPTVDDVLDGVGGDPDRARTALALENEADKPRKSLVSKLEEIVASSEVNI